MAEPERTLEERSAFEAHIRATHHFFQCDFERKPSGEYWVEAWEEKWGTWQASARHHAGEIAARLRSKATAIRKQGNPGELYR
jgi:hypothetical protein